MVKWFRLLLCIVSDRTGSGTLEAQSQKKLISLMCSSRNCRHHYRMKKLLVRFRGRDGRTFLWRLIVWWPFRRCRVRPKCLQSSACFLNASSNFPLLVMFKFILPNDLQTRPHIVLLRAIVYGQSMFSVSEVFLLLLRILLTPKANMTLETCWHL